MGKSKIKKCFTSRFDGGKIVEMDFSQLEVVGLAFLSNDKALIEDLREGKDLHCVNTASLYKTPYDVVVNAYKSGDAMWTDRRKSTKQLSFQLQYGAGATSMATSSGVDVATAKRFIDVYYSRYPQVKAWQDGVAMAIKASAIPSSRKTKKGIPAKKGWYVCPVTKRKYTFFEYDAPDFLVDRGQLTSFSPTEMKNYPVQGFATGDFMAVASQLLLDCLINHNLFDKILPIATIHDSFLFDVKPEVTMHELNTIVDVLKNTPQAVSHKWGVPFTLPVGVDVEVGPSWFDTSEL